MPKFHCRKLGALPESDLQVAAGSSIGTGSGVKFVVIAGQDGVVCVDSLRSRMFGNKVYIDLEIQVDGETSLRDAHKVAEHVHDEVEHAFPDVKHIMIHLNPANEAC